jgi:outer membrane lipase/esterase
LAPTQLTYADYYFSSDECNTESATIASSGTCDTSLDPGAQPGTSLSFAFGGSESGDDGLFNPGAPGFLAVLTDLEGYASSGRVADLSGSVFALWTGGNDYSAFVSDSGGLTTAQSVDAVLDNIENGLIRIDALGAKRAAVFNIFDLSKIPSFTSVLGTAGAQTAEDAANLHNTLLPARLDNVRTSTGMDIVLVDVAGLYDDIFDNPTRYGFTNLTQGCISDDGTGTSTGACPTTADETATLYWDGTHPTTAAHSFISELFEATIQAVDVDPGRLATIPDSALTQIEVAARGVRSQLDSWRIETAPFSAAETTSNPLETRVGDSAVFAVGANSFGSRASRGDFAGYDYDTRGGIVGIDHRYTGSDVPTILGAHIGVIDQDSDINGGGSFDNRSYTFGVYGGVRRGALSLTGQVSGHMFKVDDVQRDTSFSVLPTARSETDGWAYSGEIEGRLDIPTKLGKQTVWLVPLARLTLSSSEIDGYTETGAEFLNLSVRDSSLSRVRAGIGFNTWTVVETSAGTMTPYATVTWERDISELDWDIDATLPSGQRVSLDTSGGGQDALSVDLGIKFGLGGGTMIEASVAAMIGTSSTQGYVVPRLRFSKSF